MKKLLLVLFIIPAFIYGQDVPLTEKKVTTESMENKERKLKEKADDKVRKENTKRTNKYNKSLATHPKNQIGYIMNPSFCPFGLNYYNFFNKHFGFYVDYRNDFGVLAERPSGYESYADDLDWVVNTMEATYTWNQTSSTGGYSTFNIGAATYLFGNQNYALIGYFGIGTATNKIVTYDEYYEDVLGDYYYVSNSNNETYTNFNFGILRQTSSVVSWQLGFDSAVPGINFGMGFTWD
jgi:hypothetical protein